MKYLLALDQGTTSSRSILFDPHGKVVAVAQREFTQHYPQPGWVEHDAEEIWDTQLRTAKEVLKKAKLTAKDIAAIGITNQRETTVAWDKRTGKAIAKAIVWQDRRTAKFCDNLKAKGEAKRIGAKTGLVEDALVSAKCAGGQGARENRTSRVWHHRLLAAVEAHGRQSPRHGCEQRLTHDALQHRHWNLGHGTAEALRRAGVSTAGGEAIQRRVW
jgi:ribulose kinase